MKLKELLEFQGVPVDSFLNTEVGKRVGVAPQLEVSTSATISGGSHGNMDTFIYIQIIDFRRG
jgi:hypothetical protein